MCMWHTVLPLGLRSAPAIFSAGDLLRSSRRATVDQPQDRAHQLQAALRVCEELGVPVARGKIGGPGTTPVFLKIELDTVAGVMRLPQAKLQRQHRGLRFRSHRRSSGRWFLQRRCGARAGRAHRSCLSATARWSWRRCGQGQAGTRHLCLSCVRCSFLRLNSGLLGGSGISRENRRPSPTGSRVTFRPPR